MRKPTWKHEDVFPIIQRLIDGEYEYETSAEIIPRLLADSEARAIINSSKQQSPKDRSLEWIAGNIVGMFSKCFTLTDPKWQSCSERFHRKRIKGKWAYKRKRSGEG